MEHIKGHTLFVWLFHSVYHFPVHMSHYELNPDYRAFLYARAEKVRVLRSANKQNEVESGHPGHKNLNISRSHFRITIRFKRHILLAVSL